MEFADKEKQKEEKPRKPMVECFSKDGIFKIPTHKWFSVISVHHHIPLLSSFTPL
jgi:hypothetical protein